jgi:hypothetical protein
MIKKNKSSLLLTLGAAGLLIGGGVAGYWVLTQHDKLPGNMPVGANIIPQDALLTLSVSTNQAQWQQLREFGTQKTQAELDKNLVQWRDRLLTSNGYNYQQDIAPWVGKEVTMAVLSPQSNTPTPNSIPNPPAAAIKQQSFMMVLPIDNLVRAKQLLEKPKPLKQGKWIERTYKGVEIEQMQGVPAQNYSATILDGRYLVVTDNPKATERAIDTYKNGATLAATAGYKEAMGKIQASEPFAKLYVNIPAAARVAAFDAAKPISPQALAQFQENQGLATTMNLEPEGIRFKSISWLKPNSAQKYVVENKAGRMQSLLPAQTLMMLSGGNLQRLWQEYAQGASNPLAPMPPDNFRAGVQSLTGLDWNQDLLGWMNGEFSLSLIPSTPKGGSPENFALSLVLMVQTSDRSRAEKSFQKLDQVMSRRYQFQVQQAQVRGQRVVNWIAPYGTLSASHGWLDGDVAFLTLGAPVAEQIIPKPQTTLASTEQFQKTVPSELSPNNGQFFVDMAAAVKTFPLAQLSPEQQIWIEAMRSIGLTTAVSDERSIRYDIFVSLKKAGKIGSLPSPGIKGGLGAPSGDRGARG